MLKLFRFRQWLIGLKGGKLRNSLLISGVDGLMVIVQFGTSVVIARALLPEGRGEVATILLWPSFFFTFISAGLRFSLMYHIGAFPERRAEIIRIIAYFGMILSLAAAAANYFLIDYILTSSSDETIALTKLLGCFMPILFFSGFLPSVLQGEQRYMLWNFVRFADPFLYFIMMIGLFATNSVNLFNVALSFLVTKVLIVAYLFYKIRIPAASRRMDWRLSGSMLLYLTKCLPTSWMGQANNQLDQMLLSAFFPPQYIGWYKISVSAANLLRIVPMGLQRMVLPDVANERSAEKRMAYVQDSLKKGLLLTLLALVPALFLIGLMIRYCYGLEYSASIVPARILLVGVIFMSMNGILVNAFRGVGRPLASLLAEGVGVVVTVVGLITLLPVFGLNGAAITTLVASASTLLFLYLVYRKKLIIP